MKNIQDNSITVTQVAHYLTSHMQIVSSAATETGFVLRGLSTAKAPLPNTILFAKKLDQALADHAQEALVILPSEYRHQYHGPCIFVENPRLAFGLVVEHFFNCVSFEPEIHVSAIVHPTAIVSTQVTIGPNCYIGPNCSIEGGTTLCAGVVIYRDTKIGSKCFIRSNTVIGEDGFGVEAMDSDMTFRLPHVGGVVIGNNVNIGSLNSIASGTIFPTTIADFVQTDNLVHIAHNVKIGQGTLITACAEISGSVTIGKRVWLGPNCSVMNGITLGDDCLVGLGSVVTKNVAENSIVAGNPARHIGQRYA
jgi:UDP-3-O-[3-hydroxymyristoyl] glucosamine N-acyltransferase LpxD